MSQRKKCSWNVAVRCSLWGTHQWLPSNALPSQVHRQALCASFSHLHMGTPSASSKTQVSGTITCVSPAVSPSGSIPTSAHTALPSDHGSLPSYRATCLLLLQRSYSTELSLLMVPALSPTRSLNSLQSDFHTPTLPSSLTYMWTAIVCPTLF